MKRQFDTVLLGSIELFCLAAELGSFTAAANSAGVTPAAVSRAITRLEARLAVRLFIRTTRQIKLTDAGAAYFHHCKNALLQFTEAELEISGKQSTPSGLIKLSMPTTYGHFRVLPLLPEFRSLYPNITLDLHISNRNIDFLEEDYDLVIRGRAPPLSNFITRKIEDAKLVVVASKNYLDKAGIPLTLEQLHQHDCIQFLLPSTGKPIPWLFKKDGADHEIVTTGSYCCSEDILGGITLAKNNAGIFQTYQHCIEKELNNGTLFEILQPYSGRSRPFSLLFPHKKLLALRIRVFIDFLIDKLS